MPSYIRTYVTYVHKNLSRETSTKIKKAQLYALHPSSSYLCAPFHFPPSTDRQTDRQTDRHARLMSLTETAALYVYWTELGTYGFVFSRVITISIIPTIVNKNEVGYIVTHLC